MNFQQTISALPSAAPTPNLLITSKIRVGEGTGTTLPDAAVAGGGAVLRCGHCMMIGKVEPVSLNFGS